MFQAALSGCSQVDVIKGKTGENRLVITLNGKVGDSDVHRLLQHPHACP